jgi:hypothetical protein
VPRISRYLLLSLLACLPDVICAQTQPRQPTQRTRTPAKPSSNNSSNGNVRTQDKETKGIIVDGNVYRNPALDLTIALPGEWQFLDDQARDQAEGRTSNKPNTQACKGPLCGDPEINVALARSLEEAASSASTIFLAAFKLAPEYLDRGHYPLRHFAEIMLPGSSGKSGLVSNSAMSPIQLGGRPAYRLLLRDANAQAPKEVGYVTESNGYMILLVGAAEPSSELADLQTAIENLQFKDSPAQKPQEHP